MPLLDRLQAPALHPVGQFDLARAQSQKISNHLTIHYIKAGTQPVVELEWVLPTGRLLENKWGVASMTMSMMREGTKHHSAAEFAEKLAFYGASIETQVHSERSSLVLYVLKKHLTVVLPLLVEMVQEALLDAQSYENVHHIALQHAKIAFEKNAVQANAAFKEALFGKAHPLSFANQPDLLAAITLTDVHAYYNAYIKESAFELLLSGDIDDSVIEIVALQLGQMPQNKHVTVQQWPQLSTQRGLQVIQKANSLQSSIRLGTLQIPKSHPDYAQFKVANELFGGFFGSRLMKNIREDKGFTYGIHSSLTPLNRDSSLWAISTDVKLEHTSETLTEIFKEIKKMQEVLVTEEELGMVKNYMLGNYLSSITTPFSLLDKFKGIYFYGLDYSYYERYIASIKSTKPEDILRIAQSYWNPSDLTQIVVGDTQ